MLYQAISRSILFGSRIGRSNGCVGLRNDEIISLRCDNDAGITVAFQQDEMLSAGIRRVAAMRVNISSEFGINQTRYKGDIAQCMMPICGTAAGTDESSLMTLQATNPRARRTHRCVRCICTTELCAASTKHERRSTNSGSDRSTQQHSGGTERRRQQLWSDC